MVRIPPASIKKFEDLPLLVKNRVIGLLSNFTPEIRLEYLQNDPPEGELLEQLTGAWLYLKDISTISQSGPTCGLVALQMAMQLIGASLIAVDDILDKAREQGYTKNGEMYSTSYMALLANDLWDSSVVSCVSHFPSASEMVSHLHESTAILIPYDCDRNIEPALRKGHSAHWGIVVGYLLVDTNEKGICTPTRESISQLPINSPNLYLLIAQGKSRYYGLHPYILLEKSNAQLYEAEMSPRKRRPATPTTGSAKRAKQEPPEESDLKSVDPSEFEAYLKKTGSNKYDKATWKRPPIPHGMLQLNSVAIQVFDIETYQENGGNDSYDRTNVKLYGVNREGNSVCVIVTDHFPHFYFQAPNGFGAEHLEQAQRALNNQVSNSARRGGTSATMSQLVADNLIHLKIVEGENLYFYRGSEKKYPFLKVTGTASALSKAKNELRNGVNLMGHGPVNVGTLYEANIDGEVKFMTKTGVVGCGWVEVPIGKGKTVPDAQKLTRCQLEIRVSVKDLIIHDTEGEWLDIAPIRTVSLDIECMGRRGVFPDASEDSVIQIANMVKIEGQTEPFLRVCFVLGTCAPVIGSDIVCCKTEKELLEQWAEFIRIVDPDILTGYNILNFDLPYILDRAKVLKLPQVALLGRQKDKASGVRDAVLSSKQMGSRVNKSIDIHGRVIFDVLQVVLRDYKLRSYTLNSVSYHFLTEQKEDVDHTMIPTLQSGDDQTRRRLAVYCMKDAILPLRLLDKLMSVINYMEMARVTGVPLNYLLTRGQQIKILSMILRKCKANRFFVPVIEHQGNDGEGFEGATVIEPHRGFYNEPIATLDFASLYPSIMIAHNLCYTTLIQKPDPTYVKDQDYIQTPSGQFFATRTRRRGLLPEILEDLLATRKRAKNDLKNEKDEFRKMVLNGRQMALKISANSVYGFTGATVGKLPCLEISQSVTAFGRQMIDMTKTEVEKIYIKGARDGKCPINAKVIYGDTDSVMVRFGVKSVKEAMEIGLDAATTVSKIFPAPIKLEFEKVYYPYLLINKKRYAGLYFTKPDKHDKMDCKGLETVRRDNCPLVAKVLGTCLETLLVDRNADAALSFAKKVISDLLCNRIDISMLIISKELTKAGDK
ncbi:hypothetical protein WR25_24092 [Diploscapter pachys]|uniref:DNA polymerase n=1 Tax=Diploscapter pachys TaxID=2018661 RepID=A0A2A2K8J9_9BILA|nr:hypothetical protein WR25_24092 [Diploscapter pachys]